MGKANPEYAASDFKRALQHFSAADAPMHLPTTGLGVMRSQEKLGRTHVGPPAGRREDDHIGTGVTQQSRGRARAGTVHRSEHTRKN